MMTKFLHYNYAYYKSKPFLESIEQLNIICNY